MAENRYRCLAIGIVGIFEDLLDEHGIIIPDDGRTGAEGEAPIYGCTYGDLVDTIQAAIEKTLIPENCANRNDCFAAFLKQYAMICEPVKEDEKHGKE